jgi:hypothetical protein
LAHSTIWQRDLGPERRLWDPASHYGSGSSPGSNAPITVGDAKPPVPIDPIEYENIKTTPAYQTA